MAIYPIPATIGVVFHNDRILLVRRANPPDAGKWGFPGGKIEWGEGILSAAEREILEETGITAKAARIVTAVDCYDRQEGELRRHFTLIAVLCEWQGGEPMAGDDALEARWFTREECEQGDLVMSLDVLEIIRMSIPYIFLGAARP